MLFSRRTTNNFFLKFNFKFRTQFKYQPPQSPIPFKNIPIFFREINMAPLASSAAAGTSNRLMPLVVATTVAAAGLCTFIQMTKKKNDNNDGIHHKVEVSLPSWAKEVVSKNANKEFITDEECMHLAVSLSRQNVVENTGGPFGCAIFERDVNTNIATLVSVGINRVVPLSNSTLHGETVAIQMAQSKLKSHTMRDLPHSDGKSTRKFELFTSCEPCAMCLGATLWSGVSRIVCGATKDDAESIGFNEGPVFDASYDCLREDGIEVKKTVLQKEAAEVLKYYGEIGDIY